MAAVRQLATRAGCTAAYIENALTAAEADAAFRACAALPWRVETDAFGPQSRPTYEKVTDTAELISTRRSISAKFSFALSACSK